MMMPTARSTMLPFKANSLNSFQTPTGARNPDGAIDVAGPVELRRTYNLGTSAVPATYGEEISGHVGGAAAHLTFMVLI